MARLIALNEQDVAALKELLRREEQRRVTTQGRQGDRGVPDQEHQAPEVYVAWTQTGIPGMTLGSEVGTGSHGPDQSPASFAQPGHADCSVYRVQLPTAPGGATTLQPMLFKKTIYNLALGGIPSQHWVIVARDKGGAWWAVSAPTRVLTCTSYRIVQRVKCSGGTFVETHSWLNIPDWLGVTVTNQPACHPPGHPVVTGTGTLSETGTEMPPGGASPL